MSSQNPLALSTDDPTDSQTDSLSIAPKKLSARTLKTIDLIRKVYAGEANALEKLIQTHIGLVVNIARRHTHLCIPQEELVEVGKEGIVDAVMGFDPSLNREFSTYAFYRIYAAIQRAYPHVVHSLDNPMGNDEDSMSLLDNLVDVNLPDPIQMVAFRENRRGYSAEAVPTPMEDAVREAVEPLKKAMQHLPVLERIILELQIATPQCPARKTNQIAELLGVKPKTVSALEASGQQHLKALLAKAPLSDKPVFPSTREFYEIEDSPRQVLSSVVQKYWPIFTEAQQTVLRGYFLNDRSLEQIAKKVHLEPDAVKKRLLFAMKRLREYLSDHPTRMYDVVLRLQQDGLENLQLRHLYHLTMTQRELFELHFSRNLSCPEIADLLDIQPKTVETQINKGMRTLREVLSLPSFKREFWAGLSLDKKLELEGLFGVLPTDFVCLTEKQHQAMTLYYRHNLTELRAGERMGVSDSTVRTMLDTALANLKRHMAFRHEDWYLGDPRTPEALADYMGRYGLLGLPCPLTEREAGVLETMIVNIRKATDARGKKPDLEAARILTRLSRQLEERAQVPPTPETFLRRLKMYHLAGIEESDLTALTDKQRTVLEAVCRVGHTVTEVSEASGGMMNPTSVKSHLEKAVEKLYRQKYPPVRPLERTLAQALEILGFKGFQEKALMALSELEQTVLELVIRQGQSLPEAAKVLKTVKGTVFSVKKRALEKLGLTPPEEKRSPAPQHPEDTLLGKLERQEGLYGITPDCLEDITPEQQEVLDYHVMQGWTFAKTADHLGVNRSAIGLRKMRLLVQLKKRIAEKH